MSWTLSTKGKVAQGGIRDELEAMRDEQAETLGGYSDEVRAQQDAAFGSVETLVDRAEFHGKPVAVSLNGHVAGRPGESDAVSIYVTGELLDE